MKPTDFDKLQRSECLWGTTWLLAIAGGWFGLHRFYLRRIVTGLFMAALPFAAILAGCNMQHYPDVELETLVIYTAIFFVCGGVMEFIFPIIGVDGFFRRRGGLVWSSLGGIGSSLFAYYVKRNTGLGGRKNSFPEWSNNIIATLTLLVVFAMIMLCGKGGTLAWGDALFVFFGVFAGMLYCKDLRSIYYWSMTDSLGRALST